MFTQLRYDGSVVEGTPADKLVLTVTATDVDTPLNSIYYSLDQLDEMFFTIGPRTGELRTSGRLLDREKTPVLYFDVKASDRKDGKRKGVAGIKVGFAQNVKTFILMKNASDHDDLISGHGEKRKQRLPKEKTETKRSHFLDAKALRMREIVRDVRRQLKVCRFGKKEATAKSFSFEIVLLHNFELNILWGKILPL